MTVVEEHKVILQYVYYFLLKFKFTLLIYIFLLFQGNADVSKIDDGNSVNYYIFIY